MADLHEIRYGPLGIGFRSLAQQPSQAFLRHVIAIVEQKVGQAHDFWKEHFAARTWNQRDTSRPPVPAVFGFSPVEDRLDA